MKTIGLILARGGSKGIPNKNIQMLSGMPMIAYSINAAKYSNIDEVWVSTDSAHIRSVAKTYGAKVLDRPEELASDTSPSEDSLLHFADNVDFDRLVFIQPTSPLLRPKFIDEGLEKMGKYDSVFSVYKEHWLPRWDLSVCPLNFELHKRPRRQDKKNRQNSLDDLSNDTKEWYREAMFSMHKNSEHLYQLALDKGIAKECARFLLPLSTKTRMYMNGTVRSWVHYIQLRADPSTQKEHRDIAEEIKSIFKTQFPITADALDW